MGIFRSGKVVVLLAGRHAGKKAVVVRVFEEGDNRRKFSHALVAGIARHPRKITKSMSKRKQQRRGRIVPFLKRINLRHAMPTRYSCDLELKKLLTEENLQPEKKNGTMSDLRTKFQETYFDQTAKSAKKANALQYLHQRLRF